MMINATKSTKHNNSKYTQYYNQFRGIITDYLRWLQITTDTEKKLKVETEFKERYQELLDFITIDIIII